MGRGHIKHRQSKAAAQAVAEASTKSEKVEGYNPETDRFHCSCGDSFLRGPAFYRHKHNCQKLKVASV